VNHGRGRPDDRRRQRRRGCERALRRPRIPSIAPIPLARIAIAANRGLRDRIFENARPVEFDVGVVLLQQPDRFLVDRRASDADARRRAEPVQKALPRPAPAPARPDFGERGRLVSALVAIEAQLRQGYFLFF
jgi:hypothetical protein